MRDPGGDNIEKRKNEDGKEMDSKPSISFSALLYVKRHNIMILSRSQTASEAAGDRKDYLWQTYGI